MSRYIAFFKPYGVLSSFTFESEDDGKRTLSEFGIPKGIYAAGRLDYDSEGLVILSDDGNFSHLLTDPAHKLPKTYLVQVEGVPTEAALIKLRAGVTIRAKGVQFRTRPCEVRLRSEDDVMAAIGPAMLESRKDKPVNPKGPTAWLEIKLTEGKKRQVRHMTATVDLPTLRLLRVAVGPISVSNLGCGQWREIAPADVATIIQAANRAPPSQSRGVNQFSQPRQFRPTRKL